MPLMTAPPWPVEQTIRKLGANLRTARLRRNLSLREVAGKIGVERHTVSAAEGGKPSTGIAVYAAMLWVLGLEGQLAQVADPSGGDEGSALARSRERLRASREPGDEF